MQFRRLHKGSAMCRLADAYKTPETDRLSKVDYRRFCDDINTGGLHTPAADNFKPHLLLLICKPKGSTQCRVKKVEMRQVI